MLWGGLFIKSEGDDIYPIKADQRTFGFFDFFVLWSDLAISMLVILTGSFLIPGLSPFTAIVAIIVGSTIGCVLLAMVGMIGSATNAPTMVLLRSVLGVRGSYIPTVLNIIQLLGWTIFELVIMGFAVNALLHSILGYVSYHISLAVAAVIVIVMTVSGPSIIIKQWLKKFALWVVILASIWMAIWIFRTHDIAKLFSQPGNNSLSFWAGVDLVIAMPISWLPLVADYNRFARSNRSGVLGTFFGYFMSNIWFYFLGVLLMLSTGITQDMRGFVETIIINGSWIALIILVIDETHEAWANLYSSVVSTQNIFPDVNQKLLIVVFGFFAFLIAFVLDITQFENFLFLIGSVFIPLFAILITDFYIIRKGSIQSMQLYRNNGKFWFHNGFNWTVITIWVVGIATYHTIIRAYPDISASIFSLVVVCLLYVAVNKYLARTSI